MKSFILFVLATTFCFGQSATRQAFDTFKSELEAYQSNTANMQLKPADCKEYKLVYIVKGSNFQEIVIPTNASGLCTDLVRYDTSKKVAPAGESYDIKAIGNKYYAIRVDQNDGQVMQTWYYYMRK
ncbi:MAG: hypothetical protein EOO48_06800 [Flavobacterium sp.]|nr:MAG: hypothetical protein EOO48_06800 [Flavobacterium sp.]